MVEESREQIAQAFGARPSEVVFTSGGTEADNLAVKGLFWARHGSGAAAAARGGSWPRPSSTTRCSTRVQWLGEHQGAEIEWLPVDSAGLLSPDVLRAAIERDPDSVALVSVMWANNEVGTVQPIAELAEVAAEFGIPFHSDAVQAAGQLPVSLAASGATALTVTGHKIGGPVGAGALLLRQGRGPGAGRCTAAARSATSGPGPSTRRPSRPSRSRVEHAAAQPGRARGADRPACATAWSSGSEASCPMRS